ncbi:DUF6338 family protein [Vibrio sp. EA2]|uniref:DUF6338 family protein n=1 Tax=Vibrio sp. EA2 TaxID=3079860 RepID=UPI002949DBCF|nr:DUF6338 family protein [Vibrio sp. EA2]MDV6251060.1 DUF6338 family protein [Vibrio sp. EA2]
MNIWEIDKLLLFIAFVIPGFISIRAYEMFFPGNSEDSSKKLIDAITYSCVNYGFLWPLIYWVEYIELSGIIYGAFYSFVLFFAPILWVSLWKRLRETQYVQKRLPHPANKAWDFVFSQRKCYWVIVTLNDGSKLAGKYGSNSFVTSSPYQEQIYLEESWELNSDGGFERPHEQTSGILIIADDISYLEFFE